ncbi:sodium/glutamate symporter [Halalkalibacillus halophilus]|uniref:sodium/glutamate symporter n=1 Tax=Halalkalibacillus halophilus TaxID=392827 RepID=UPI00040C3E27|nr:sodium/glutamate symporter [Halalkalibacillus halophilus]
MSPDQIGFALVYLGLFLLIGKWLRVRLKFLQDLFLPSSVIAGFLALLAGPQVLGKLITPYIGEDSFFSNGVMTESITEVWATLPGLLINVVFATLFLGTILPSLSKIWKVGGPQLTFGWTIGWGQYVVGILLAILVLGPFFGMPPMVGALIEVGFEGGHGTAAGLQGTFEDIGFAEAYDLAIGLATVGILSGVLIGILFINWAVKKNHTVIMKDMKDQSNVKRAGIVEFENREPAAKMTVSPESIEPMSLHIAVISAAILVGYVILEGFIFTEAALIGSDFMTYIPLFPLAMIGGILVQLFFTKIDNTEVIDRRMISRIQGLSLDVLVLSAIATVSLEVIGTYIVPFLLLAGVGIAWNVIGFFLLAPRMIPSYWLERAIGDFGQSMGITATGLLLIRVADPEGKSPALEGFGYKQLVFEPFLGGGLVTALSVPLIFQFGPIPFLIFATIMMLIGLLVGLLYFGKMKE